MEPEKKFAIGCADHLTRFSGRGSGTAEVRDPTASRTAEKPASYSDEWIRNGFNSQRAPRIFRARGQCLPSFA